MKSASPPAGSPINFVRSNSRSALLRAGAGAQERYAEKNSLLQPQKFRMSSSSSFTMLPAEDRKASPGNAHETRNAVAEWQIDEKSSLGKPKTVKVHLSSQTQGLQDLSSVPLRYRAPEPETPQSPSTSSTAIVVAKDAKEQRIRSAMMSLPRSLSLPKGTGQGLLTGALSRLMWKPQTNDRVPKGTGMLARIERLRQAAIEMHKNLQQNREAINEIKKARGLAITNGSTSEEMATLLPSSASQQQVVEAPPPQFCCSPEVEIEEGEMYTLTAADCKTQAQ